MLVVDPSSTCDVCLEPYDWDTLDRTPHLVACGHIFCLQCLQKVFPPRCPMCRKLYLPSDMQKLHADCANSEEKDEEVELLKRLVLSSDSTEEEILHIRIEVDAWLEGRVYDEASPLRRARDALESYQQLKLRKSQDRRKIKVLEKAARQYEKSVQDNISRQRVEAARNEEALRNQISQQQAEITRLKAEIASKRQHTERKSKRQHTHPLITNRNPLPEPPRLIPPTTTWSMAWSTREVRRGIQGYGPRNTPLPGAVDDDLDADDEAAFWTCRTRTAWLDDEPLLQRPQGNYC